MIPTDDGLRTRSTPCRIHAALLAALLVAAWGAPSFAQAPTEPEVDEAPTAPDPEELPPEPPAPAPQFGDIEVITVRGQNRDDLLQDTAISATSFDTKELDDLRIQNIADLAEYTPNLDINTRSAASNPTLFIRGIGLKDYNANSAGDVAVYHDGLNINCPATPPAQLFDTGPIA